MAGVYLHQGRWKAEGCAGSWRWWNERKWNRWRSRRENRSTCAWDMVMTMEWMKNKLEPQCVCNYQRRQSKDNDTDWQQRQRKRRIFNACKLMHWHQLRSTSNVPQVCQVTSHIVGFRSVLRVLNLNSCRRNHSLNFDLYANSFESSHCATGSFQCCL